MHRIARAAMAAIAFYAAAAAMSSHVAMDLRATDWLNLWTYLAILFSLPTLIVALWVCVAIAGVVSAAITAGGR